MNKMDARRLVVLTLCIFCVYSVYCVVVKIHNTSGLIGEHLVIKIRTGLIKGTVEGSRNGRSYHAFYGIPYAKPPVGKLRLQPPTEPSIWRGIRDASVRSPPCIHSANLQDRNAGSQGQEDCLYLNVFAPDVFNPTRKLPVLVHIHGEAFLYSDAGEYGAEYLLDQDIIFVNFNYRTGALGFLSMNDSLIPGNFGLKDQTMALKWVKENIGVFGGNPDDVTLMGDSNGAAYTHLHFFSPLSNGLFHKAILMSGSAFTTWSFYDEFHTKSLGTAFAVTAGCYFEDPSQVLDCLQKLPAETFTRKENNLMIDGNEPSGLFKPSVEKNSDDPFLPCAPSIDAYQTREIPILTGITSGEGIIKVAEYLSNTEAAEELRTEYKQYLPLVFQYLFTNDPKRMDEVTEQIKIFHLKNRDAGPETDFQLVDMFTDGLFFHPLITTVLSYQGPRYVYFFDYSREVSVQTKWGYSRNLGVCHGDDVTLILYNATVDSTLSATDNHVSDRLINYWAHFVTYGDPNEPETEKLWKPVSTNAVEYLHIKNESDTMKSKLWVERFNFWNSLPLGRTYNNGSDILLSLNYTYS